jgi:hypothetical protein
MINFTLPTTVKNLEEKRLVEPSTPLGKERKYYIKLHQRERSLL